MKKFAQIRGTEPGKIVVGYGYDDTLMPEGESFTRNNLDPVFPDNPVVVIHVSEHGGVLKSAALRKFGISAATKTPPTG